MLGCWLICLTAKAAEADSTRNAIYQGAQLKLDLGSPILEMARSSAKVQTYEMALNINLLQRFFPTFEAG